MMRQIVLKFLPNPKRFQVIKHANSFILIYVKRINMELGWTLITYVSLLLWNFIILVLIKRILISPQSDVPLEPKD